MAHIKGEEEERNGRSKKWGIVNVQWLKLMPYMCATDVIFEYDVH